MICTFALRICQYDKNIAFQHDWLGDFSLCMRKHLYRGLFEIVIVFVYIYKCIHVLDDSPVTVLYTNKIDLIW